MPGAQKTVFILRRCDAQVTATKDSFRSGVCRVCRCVYEYACPSGCSWVSAAETLCSSCATFAELSRREIVDLLYDAGYVSTHDLRAASGELQEGIEDFVHVFEAVAQGGDLKSLSFAIRNWETAEAFTDGLQARGLLIVAVPRRQLACA